MTVLSMIVAVSENGFIGKENRIPWHIKEELSYFKSVTYGHPIIMGRRTFESIGRPLPGRLNIVVTRNAAYQASGVTLCHDLASAVDCAKAQDSTEVFIIGGATLYEQSMKWVDRIYLSVVNKKVEGDTSMPHVDWHAWQQKEEKPFSEFKAYIYDRKECAQHESSHMGIHTS